MSRLTKRLLLVVFVLGVAAVVVACSSAAVPAKGDIVSPSPPATSNIAPANGLVQSSTGGAVTIDVKLAKAENGYLVLDVTMNTHSVNLDPYDLGELAVLRDYEGKEYGPISWRSAPGGHHRKGTLTFALPESLSQGKTKYFDLILRDIAGVKERVLKWELV